MDIHAEKRGAGAAAEPIPSYFRPRAGHPVSRREFEDFLRDALRTNEQPSFLTFFGALRAGAVLTPGDLPPMPPHPVLTVLADDPARDQRSRTSALLDPGGNAALAAYPQDERLARLVFQHGFGYGEGAGGLIPLVAAITVGATSTIIDVDALLRRPEGDPAGEAVRAYQARVRELEALGRPLATDPEMRRLSVALSEHAEPKEVVVVIGATPSFERLMRAEAGASGLVGFVQAELDPSLSSGSALVDERGMFFHVTSAPRAGASEGAFVWGDLAGDLPAAPGEARSLETPSRSGRPASLADSMTDNFMNAVLAMFFRGYEAGLRARRRTHAPSMESRSSYLFTTHQGETNALLRRHLPDARQRMVAERLSMSPETAEVVREHDVNPQVLLAFHQHGDWGDASEAEREESERVLAEVGDAPGPSGLVVSRFRAGHPALPEGYAGPDLTFVTLVTDADQASHFSVVGDRRALSEAIRERRYKNPYKATEPGADPYDPELPPHMPVGTVTALCVPASEAESLAALREALKRFARDAA